MPALFLGLAVGLFSGGLGLAAYAAVTALYDGWDIWLEIAFCLGGAAWIAACYAIGRAS